MDSKGKRVHTLDSAALQVGYSKKTLDDYYYQLRHGEQFGFDFEKHRYDKIGVLRRFVRECLRREMVRGAIAPESDIDQYLASSDSDEERRNR